MQFIQQAAGMIFVPRGDVADFDINYGGLTIDAAWHDYDFSSIVGAKHVLLVIRGSVATTADDGVIFMRKKGHTGMFNMAGWNAYAPGDNQSTHQIVETDDNGVISYMGDATTALTYYDFLVRGWIEL